MAAIVVAVIVVIHHSSDGLDDDTTRCEQAARILHIAPIAGPLGRLDIVEITAQDAAVEYITASLSAHPWDQEPAGTAVLECEGSSATWFIDHLGRTSTLNRGYAIPLTGTTLPIGTLPPPTGP